MEQFKILGLHTQKFTGFTSARPFIEVTFAHPVVSCHAPSLGNHHQYLKIPNDIRMSALIESWALSQSHFCLPDDHGPTSREKEERKKCTKDSFKTLSPFTYPKPDVVCLSNSKGFALPNACAVYS